GSDVRALDLALGNVGPVDVEVVVGDECVRPLACFGLECLELFELALTRFVDQTLLDVRWELDREHAEVALLVDLDGRVPRGAGHLLVSSEQSVLERGDEGSALDSLFALDVANCFNDFLAHLPTPLRSGSPGRSRRTGCPLIAHRS